MSRARGALRKIALAALIFGGGAAAAAADPGRDLAAELAALARAEGDALGLLVAARLSLGENRAALLAEALLWAARDPALADLISRELAPPFP